jgi:hypothetical protein
MATAPHHAWDDLTEDQAKLVCERWGLHTTYDGDTGQQRPALYKDRVMADPRAQAEPVRGVTGTAEKAPTRPFGKKGKGWWKGKGKYGKYQVGDYLAWCAVTETWTTTGSWEDWKNKKKFREKSMAPVHDGDAAAVIAKNLGRRVENDRRRPEQKKGLAAGGKRDRSKPKRKKLNLPDVLSEEEDEGEKVPRGLACAVTALDFTSALDGTGIPEYLQADMFVNLLQLNLSHNKLDEVGELGGFVHLEELDLSHNSINDDWLDELGKMTGLIRLYLDHNEIETIEPLTKLTELEELNLSHNEINQETINVNPGVGASMKSNWGNLEHLDLRGNDLVSTVFPWKELKEKRGQLIQIYV